MSDTVKELYWIVLEGTGGEESNYRGIRTLAFFPSKEKFDEWQRTRTNQDIIVEQGISEERAKELASTTTGKARAWAAILASQSLELLMLELQKQAYAAQAEGHLREFKAELLDISSRVMRFALSIRSK